MLISDPSNLKEANRLAYIEIESLHEMIEARDKDIALLRQALIDILHPMKYLQRVADASGAQLNTIAPSIADSPALFVEIARKALAAERRSSCEAI